VLAESDALGNHIFYVSTAEVLSHDYPNYLPFLNEHFADADIAGVVNWHEGANAPDHILTVHSTGDVESGVFGAAHSGWTRALLLALEFHRIRLGLEEFSTQTEATHWSGIHYGGDPLLIRDYAVPVVDIEIGSSAVSWSNPLAAEVLAHSLAEVFTTTADTGPMPRSIPCLGGVHIEPGFVEPVLQGAHGTHPLAVSHILPNQWLVSGDYGGPGGDEKLRACVESIAGGIHGIAVHAKLKGAIKNAARRLGEALDVAVFNHRKLRDPAGLPIWV